jgi:hypothetical protein
LLKLTNIVRLNETSKLFFFFVILFVNIYFFAYWSIKMIGEIRNTMRKSAGKLYMYIFLCGSKTKLEDEKRTREIQDENDILKEQFDTCKNITNKLIDLNDIRSLWSPHPK